MLPPLVLANASSFAFSALVKLYDDAIDNGWSLPETHLHVMRAAMVALYFVIIASSTEMHILFGCAALYMLAADKVILGGGSSGDSGDHKKPHNLDHAFFYAFAWLVLAVFVAFCVLNPSAVILHATWPVMVVVLLLCIAGFFDQLVTPEEYSRKKAIVRTGSAVACAVALVVVDRVQALEPFAPVLTPLLWSFLGYNLVWTLTHWFTPPPAQDVPSETPPAAQTPSQDPAPLPPCSPSDPPPSCTAPGSSCG